MTTHYNKKELKQPDIMTQELKKGFKWTTQHSKIVVGAIVVFILVGIGLSAYQYVSEKKETQAQESYYKIERDYLKKKDAFNRAENPEKPKAGKQPEAAADAVKATGDFDKDYGPVVQQFLELIAQFPNSHAARMSALILSEIDFKYHREKEALDTMNKIQLGSDLLSAMVLEQKGTAQANLNDCPQAVATWGQVLAMKSAQILEGEVYLRQGLCFEAMNERTKAEEAYNKIIAGAKDKAIAGAAEKYLRLLKLTEKTKVN